MYLKSTSYNFRPQESSRKGEAKKAIKLGWDSYGRMTEGCTVFPLLLPRQQQTGNRPGSVDQDEVDSASVWIPFAAYSQQSAE